MITFDLKTPIVSADQPFYMLHPGKNHHLFDKFIEHQCVSMDLPNLEIEDGVSPSKEKTIDELIHRSRAIRDWLAQNSEVRKSTEVPLELDEYRVDKPRYFHESFKETLTTILWDLPEGTQIFVPNPALYKDGFFCELQGNREDRVRFSGYRYSDQF